MNKSEQKEFEERMDNYKALRQAKIPKILGIWTGIYLALFLLAIDTINYLIESFMKLDKPIIYGIDAFILVILLIAFDGLTKKYIEDTFKPVLATGNFVATVESQPGIIKTKHGISISAFRIKDIIYDAELKDKINEAERHAD